MDRIISARIDESAAALLEVLARTLGKSKKRVPEEALRSYAEGADKAAGLDLLDETWGAWERRESVPLTVRKVRSACCAWALFSVGAHVLRHARGSARHRPAHVPL